MSAVLDMKLSLARTVGALSRLRGGGTSVPGKVLLGLQPDAIGVLGARLTDPEQRDRQLRYLADVLDVVGRLGISQVGLATKPQGK